MKKNNMKKLGLLLATVCGVQVICASIIKGEEAKAGFFGNAMRSVASFFRGGTASNSNIGMTNTAPDFSQYRQTNFYKQGDPTRRRVFTPATNQHNSVITPQDGGDGLIQVTKSSSGLESRVKVNPGGVYTEAYKDGQMVLKSNRVGNKTTTEWIGGSGFVNKREVRSPGKVKITTFDDNGNKLSSTTHKR